MKQLSIVALSALVVVLGAPTTVRADRSVNARLSGFQEVPANSTTGKGRFEAKIDERADAIDYELSYENLEGTTTLFAHIHLGQKTANGGIMVFLCGGGGKPACPATSGTVNGTITPADVIGPTGQGIAPGEFAEVIRAIQAGAAYANVHTNKHPGGEIRGQIAGDDND